MGKIVFQVILTNIKGPYNNNISTIDYFQNKGLRSYEKTMKRITFEFFFPLIVLFQILGWSSSASGDSVLNNSNNNRRRAVQQSECIPINDDYRSFYCVSSPPQEEEELLRVQCLDEDKRCSDWANRGECGRNPQFMLTGCRKSCKSCIDLHGHTSNSIPQIADAQTRREVLKRLFETQKYMHLQAKRNIETIQRCVNKHAECTHWYILGECSANPTFMDTECPVSCMTCNKVVP